MLQKEAKVKKISVSFIPQYAVVPLTLPAKHRISLSYNDFNLSYEILFSM
jgi:hypothetical protein